MMADVRWGLLCSVVTAVAVTASACASERTAPSAIPQPDTSVTPATSAAAPPTLAEEIRQWKARAGGHFTESGRALQEVSEASAAGDEAALRDGCTRLHDANTLGLQRDLPTPDPLLTDELQRMIDDINTATHACLRFALGREDVDAENYREFLGRAVEHLHRAKTILDADSAPK